MLTRPKKQFCINGHDTFVVGRRPSGTCTECNRIYIRNASKTIKGKVKRRKKDKKYSKTEKRKQYKREWARRQRQTEKYKEYFVPYKKQYDKEHPQQVKKSRLKAKTNRGLRVVSWGQDGMNEYYSNIPDGMVVDHKIPLVGKKVSGFHVVWNLQYLPKIDNLKKNNRIDLLEASQWYGTVLKEAGLK